LTEIGTDIFFTNKTSTKPSAGAKSVTGDKKIRHADSDSDCDDIHGTVSNIITSLLHQLTVFLFY